MYTEVIQDSVITLMKEGRCTFAGGCSLTVSDAMLAEMYKDLDFYKSKVILRRRKSPTTLKSCAAWASSASTRPLKWTSSAR